MKNEAKSFESLAKKKWLKNIFLLLYATWNVKNESHPFFSLWVASSIQYSTLKMVDVSVSNSKFDLSIKKSHWIWLFTNPYFMSFLFL